MPSRDNSNDPLHLPHPSYDFDDSHLMPPDASTNFLPRPMSRFSPPTRQEPPITLDPFSGRRPEPDYCRAPDASTNFQPVPWPRSSPPIRQEPPLPPTVHHGLIPPRSQPNHASIQGRGFIERHEEQKGVSNHLHWPGGHSGPTLGPGYDMRDRSRAEVEQRLRSIDLDARTAASAAAGAGLQGDAAKTFARDNKNLINLTDDQQERLLQINLPHYEAMVHRGVKVTLTQNEFDALVSFVYNPGRGWKGVRDAINSGDKAKAARIIEEQVRSGGKVMRGLVMRRHDEAMLLLKGQYK